MPRSVQPWSGGLRRAVLTATLLGVLPVHAASLSDLTKHELVGPVKSVVTKHPQFRIIHQFDESGRLVEMELQATGELHLSHYVFLYDALGRLMEEDTVEADGNILYRKSYRYGQDDHGRESAVVATTEDGALAHADFRLYDDRGLLVEEVAFNGNGLAEKSLYDVQGNFIYTARYFQGKLVLEASHHYGPAGRIEESRFYNGDGHLMRRDFYRYDEAGRRIEHQSEFLRSAYLRKSVVTYEIDEVGNWTRETIQRWTEKNGILSVSETTVSREREISYY